MILRLCAWHRRYHGYPWCYGVSWWGWRQWGATHGVCRGCLARVRREVLAHRR